MVSAIQQLKVFSRKLDSGNLQDSTIFVNDPDFQLTSRPFLITEAEI